jgi:lambda family phage holin
LSASSIIEWMAWPSNLSIGAGGAIGFIGVTAIRELIIRLISRKVDAA